MQKFSTVSILLFSLFSFFLPGNTDVLAQQKGTIVRKKTGTKAPKKSASNKVGTNPTSKTNDSDFILGSGSGNLTGHKTSDSQAANCKGETTAIKILSQPQVSINNEARRAMQLSGTVRLRVTFLASGEVGLISPINRLPYGLTEDSITAARKIKFVPAKECGVAVTAAKVVEYSFNLY
jgi:hypothetical protein